MKKRRGGCFWFVLRFLMISLYALLVVAGVWYLRGFLGERGGAGEGDAWEIPYQEVAQGEESFAGGYYYGLLGEEERLAYREICEGVRARADEIYVHCADAGAVNRILGEVLRDYPEFFWCDGAVSSTSYERGDGEEEYTVAKPEYNCSAQEMQARQAQIDGAAEEALRGISMDASDYEKILYVYEYIVNSVDYDLEALDNQNLYSSLVGKRSVCAGYSKAAQYLLGKLGVLAVYVTGTVNNQGSHAWNLAQCEGEYYHVDTTWGDPVYQLAEGEEPPKWQNITYDYMCCSDWEIYRTHTADSQYPLPECSGMRWNYYVVNGMYYESYDSGAALDALNAAIYEKRNPTVFKFFDEAAYQQAKEEILGDLIQQAAQNLCGIYGLEGVEYYYEDRPELCKLTIYWDYQT